MDLWVWKKCCQNLAHLFEDLQCSFLVPREPRSASNEWSKLAIHLFAWAKDHQQVVEGALLDSAELVYDPDITKHW